jgi:hypothetical protein
VRGGPKEERVRELISPLDMTEERSPEQEEDPVSDETQIDLDAVRELVLRTHPDVVPELVTGDSVAALLASVEPARSAFERLTASWQERRPDAGDTAAVPAGGGAPIAVDPDRLPAAEKIRRGLSALTHKR